MKSCRKCNNAHLRVVQRVDDTPLEIPRRREDRDGSGWGVVCCAVLGLALYVAGYWVTVGRLK